MLSSFCTDKINIISRSYDQNGGITGTSTQSNVSCYIEDYNKNILDKNGKEVLGSTLIIIPSENVTGVEYSDRIQIVSQGLQAFEFPDKEFQILKKGYQHSFSEDYWEVVL